MSARIDKGDTHWPQVFWTEIELARLTCTCGAVDTEPVALAHLRAFEAAEEQLLYRHGCAIARDSSENGVDVMRALRV